MPRLTFSGRPGVGGRLNCAALCYESKNKWPYLSSRGAIAASCWGGASRRKFQPDSPRGSQGFSHSVLPSFSLVLSDSVRLISLSNLYICTLVKPEEEIVYSRMGYFCTIRNYNWTISAKKKYFLRKIWALSSF